VAFDGCGEWESETHKRHDERGTSKRNDEKHN